MYIYLNGCKQITDVKLLLLRGAFNKFLDFFVQAFKIVVDF